MKINQSIDSHSLSMSEPLPTKPNVNALFNFPMNLDTQSVLGSTSNEKFYVNLKCSIGSFFAITFTTRVITANVQHIAIWTGSKGAVPNRADPMVKFEANTIKC